MNVLAQLKPKLKALRSRDRAIIYARIAPALKERVMELAGKMDPPRELQEIVTAGLEAFVAESSKK